MRDLVNRGIARSSEIDLRVGARIAVNKFHTTGRASANRLKEWGKSLTSAATCQEFPEFYFKYVLGLTFQVAFEQRRLKGIEPGRNRGMGGKEIAGARSGQRNLERLSVLDHEFICAFEYGKGRVAFVQMADFRFETMARSSRQPPMPSTNYCSRRNSFPPP